MKFKDKFANRKPTEVEVLGQKVYFKALPLGWYLDNAKREDKSELGLEILSLRLVDAEGNQQCTIEEIKELDTELFDALMDAMPNETKKKNSLT